MFSLFDWIDWMTFPTVKKNLFWQKPLQLNFLKNVSKTARKELFKKEK